MRISHSATVSRSGAGSGVTTVPDHRGHCWPSNTSPAAEFVLSIPCQEKIVGRCRNHAVSGQRAGCDVITRLIMPAGKNRLDFPVAADGEEQLIAVGWRK